MGFPLRLRGGSGFSGARILQLLKVIYAQREGGGINAHFGNWRVALFENIAQVPLSGF